MSEHERPPKSHAVRRYRQSKRAEDVQNTRQRIIEAAVELHETLGPAQTSVSALAEAAGVTRLTVYRHFPDAESLFGACSAAWAARQDLPDPDAWGAAADGVERLGTALADLYRFYSEAAPMLEKVIRDADAVPEALRRERLTRQERYVDVLLEGFGDRQPDGLHAALAHAVEFPTWQTLARQGLSSDEAADLMVRMVCGVVSPAVGPPNR